MQLNGTLANSKEAVASSTSEKKKVYQLASLVIELTCNTKSYLAWLLLHVLTQSLSGSAWFSCMLSAFLILAS